MKQSFLSSALSMFGRGKKEERCAAVDAAKETKVYFEEGGTKYHTNAHCSGMRKPQYIPLSVAKKRGLSPCKKCAPYGVAPTVRPAPTAPPFVSSTASEFQVVPPCGGHLGIDVRRADGLLYTQEMYNHFHYWKMNLEIEIGRERETAGGFGGD